MAYDDELADRLRARLSSEPDMTEKRMFGGLAFMVAGHLVVAAGNHGGLLLRADPSALPELLADSRVSPFVMRGKPMSGWLHVDVDDLVDDDDLHPWVDQGTAFARSLPPR